MRVESVERHANELLDLLVDVGPVTGAVCCEKLGWSRGRFDAALRYAREHLCPELGISIPNPTPAKGWLYEATTEWQPVEEGAGYALGLAESRLRGVLRDVRIVRPHIPPRTKESRRASFLDKHLSHILSVLAEIDNE